MENEIGLMGEAVALDGETLQATEVAAEVASGPVFDPVAEAADLIRFAVALFVPLYPSLGAVYTDQAQARLAAVAGPVMAKYGVTMGGLFEKWGPEINLAIVGIPLVLETGRAIRADTEARNSQPGREPDNEQK